MPRPTTLLRPFRSGANASGFACPSPARGRAPARAIAAGLFAAALSVLLLRVPAHAAPIDDASLALPRAGDTALRVLSPNLLEITLVSAPAAEAPAPALDTQFHRDDFHVTVDDHAAEVVALGFKRRVWYAPVKTRDLRVATELYLELKTPLPGGVDHAVTVTAVHHDRGGADEPWPKGARLTANTARLRDSPAIHVNQEGYTPGRTKVAIVGYYLGTLGELPIPADQGFDVIDVATGTAVFHGNLVASRDVGFSYTPRPYQHVYAADFSAVKTPGEYRITVAGLGASLPFRIDEGETMNFARAYALGLYEQRCGAPSALPFTRFVHDACHTAPAAVPEPADRFGKAWDIIRDLGKDAVKSDRHSRQLKDSDDQLYPFVRGGSIDVAGGHHDAGDYSKYTIDSAQLIHVLMFAVDAFPGVAELDNLGIPESGDGVSDVMQEAKWEADFLVKMQDTDGGFYFLVYPRDQRYEGDVLPDHGDPQIVWPKNTSGTAAAVAALAQCGSSPRFARQYPAEAKKYLEAARRGWDFLDHAVAAHGRIGAYQRLTHYGDTFADDDELAWAACELFVATGEPKYRDALRKLYPDPADPSTMLWGWGHASFAYGNALRSYAFAVRTGRLRADQVDAAYRAKCEVELQRAADDVLRWAQQSAYGTSFPEPTKRQNLAGWYFSSDQAFDLTVAYQLAPRPEYAQAVYSNLDYEAGCNPVNVCFVTGLGQHRQREIVDQYSKNDVRTLPRSGLPLGNIQGAFEYLTWYKTQLRDLSVPADDAHPPYPLYDRWSDAYNVTTEFTIVSQGRSLASLAFWAAQTGLKEQRWKPLAATIPAPRGVVGLNRPIRFHLECPGFDFSDARIAWEGRDQEPAYGATFAYVPHSAGPQWVEAEAALPDGRRVFAHADFRANAPIVIWVDGKLPRGATPMAQGGDNWNWIAAKTKPAGLESHLRLPQHESALATGIHEHGFADAEETLDVEPGDVLFAYAFIDPRHPPRTIMLEWNDGSNEHRAFWGENLIPWGKMDTASQRPMGALPPAGRWVRLDVPASAVGLEGRTVKGMVFRVYGGRMRWDAAGKMTRGEKDLGLFHAPPPDPS